MILSEQALVIWESQSERVVVQLRDAWEGAESRMDLLIERQDLSTGESPAWYGVDDPICLSPSQALAVRDAIDKYLLPINTLTGA